MPSTLHSTGRFRYIEALPPPSIRPRGALVLLHAFPLNARMWEGQLGLADRGWRVIVPQFRMFDGGAGDPPASSVDDYAGDVVDLLDALAIHQAVIGGLSMGGYVAFAMVRHARRYIQGLVLADTKSPADTAEGVEGRKRLLKTLAERGPSAIADEMIPKLLGETTRRSQPDVADRVRSLILSNSTEAIAGAILALMTRPDSTPLLDAIHVPTLVIVGDEDTLTPPGQSSAMQQAIPGSALVTIAGAGHLSNLEQPDLFNAALAAFLDHKV